MADVIQLTPLLLIYGSAALVTIGLTGYGYRQLRDSGRDKTTLAFIGIVLSASIWCISRFFELLLVSHVVSRFWLTMIYVGYGGSTMGALLFALAFTGRKHWLTKRRVAMLLFLPFIAVIVAGTNQYHELFWVGSFQMESGWYGQDISFHEREFQLAFKLYLGYTVGGALIGLGLLMRNTIGSPDVYRRQTLAFGFGAGTAILFGVLFGLEAQPVVPHFVDLTPVGYAIMGLCFAYGIFRYQMLDLVPVARDTVIESMRDGFIVTDTDDRVVDLNDAAREMIDADGNVVGEDIEDAFPACADAIETHEAGTRSEAEITLERDDETRFLIADISSLSDDDRLIGRLVLLRDVTERRAVQKRYQALIENSSDLILVVDEDGEVTYASPSVENITGVDPDVVVGQPALELVHEADRDKVAGLLDDSEANPGEVLRAEYRTRDADTNTLHMEASIRNLLDNPFVEGIVVNAREITQRKKREQELEEANEELEQANEQLEQFAGVISHDLRNPINVARGHLDLAQETGREESFEKISDSLQRMEAIIDDVLTLAREGQSIGETEDVSLNERAELAWDHVATDEAELVVADDAHFQADPDRLLQLFENLFRNAHEHVGDDVQVTVGVDDGTLYVEDDGPGIPEDRRDKVFESGHTTNQGGTGLGLSIVSQIADAHDWGVAVAEGSQGGARFEFPGVNEE